MMLGTTNIKLTLGTCTTISHPSRRLVVASLSTPLRPSSVCALSKLDYTNVVCIYSIRSGVWLIVTNGLLLFCWTCLPAEILRRTVLTSLRTNNVVNKTFGRHLYSSDAEVKDSLPLPRIILLHHLYNFLIPSVVTGALRYVPEGRGFDSRWCHWNSSLT